MDELQIDKQYLSVFYDGPKNFATKSIQKNVPNRNTLI